MTTATATAGLDALDQLSRQLLAGAAGMRVEIAESPEEREAIHRLRHRQVVEHGWAQADDLPAGVERDAHDAFAVQIGAWLGADLVGAMRLVFPSPGRRLPVEEAFAVDVKPSGEVVEAGRLVIPPEHRGDPAHATWGALFARAWLTMRSRGYSLLAGSASLTMVERLKGFGLPFEILGAPRSHWGQERVPVRLDPAGGDPRWFGARDG
jgi:N-acyl-L-homoserine lactone synthetase